MFLAMKFGTQNCSSNAKGIGFAIIIDPAHLDKTHAALKKQGIDAFVIGKVIRHAKQKVVFQ